MMMKRRYHRIVTAVMFLGLSWNMTMAQQLPVFSHHMFNKFALNPAVAGSERFIDFKLNHRSQWVGFDGAPVTQVLSGHAILPNGKMGVGGYLFNDAAGPFRRIGLNLAYAHHLQLGSMNLSLGLSGGLLQYSVDGREINLYDPTDQTVDLTTRDRSMTPDANFGMLMYNEDLYVGFSALHLLKGKLDFFESGGNASYVPLENHYYFMGGYKAEINPKFTLEPAALVQMVQANPTQLHINLNMSYDDKVIAGAGYRTGDAMVLLVGCRFAEAFMVAYSYDLLLSGLKTSNTGSHEITVGYQLAYKTGEGPLKKRYKLNKVRVN
ncbi:MAG: type IX secretion system membrane protein PorP/SprF [Flavobacteriales bacterium]|nr:type IX secretion system membrane protein PorP/SprF [Flavobacteriales bacterium]